MNEEFQIDQLTPMLERAPPLDPTFPSPSEPKVLERTWMGVGALFCTNVPEEFAVHDLELAAASPDRSTSIVGGVGFRISVDEHEVLEGEPGRGLVLAVRCGPLEGGVAGVHVEDPGGPSSTEGHLAATVDDHVGHGVVANPGRTVQDDGDRIRAAVEADPTTGRHRGPEGVGGAACPGPRSHRPVDLREGVGKGGGGNPAVPLVPSGGRPVGEWRQDRVVERFGLGRLVSTGRQGQEGAHRHEIHARNSHLRELNAIQGLRNGLPGISIESDWQPTERIGTIRPMVWLQAIVLSASFACFAALLALGSWRMAALSREADRLLTPSINASA